MPLDIERRADGGGGELTNLVLLQANQQPRFGHQIVKIRDGRMYVIAPIVAAIDEGIGTADGQDGDSHDAKPTIIDQRHQWDVDLGDAAVVVALQPLEFVARDLGGGLVILIKIALVISIVSDGKLKVDVMDTEFGSTSANLLTRDRLDGTLIGRQEEFRDDNLPVDLGIVIEILCHRNQLAIQRLSMVDQGVIDGLVIIGAGSIPPEGLQERLEPPVPIAAVGVPRSEIQLVRKGQR